MRKLYIISGVLVIFCIGLLKGCYTPNQSETSYIEEQSEEEVIYPDTLKMIFVGDIMGHMPQITAAKNDGGDSIYNFFPTFQYVKEYISSAHLALANLEVTFGGIPYKGYPRFSCPHELATGLKETGFNFLFTANNHAADKGQKGIEDTLDYIRELDFYHTGTFKDSAEWRRDYPLLLEINNIRLAFLNYTYDTNGLDVPQPNIVNCIDTIQIKADLEKAKALHPDYIIASMHWGYEYHSKENADQRKQAQFLADNGANLIIGSHPHVVQPYKMIYTEQGDSVPVIYSLGNFISNQRDRYKNGGIAFEVTLEKEEDKINLLSVTYEPCWVNCFHENGKRYYRIIPVNGYLKDSVPYNMTTEQVKEMMQFYDDTAKNLDNLPYSNFFALEDI